MTAESVHIGAEEPEVGSIGSERLSMPTKNMQQAGSATPLYSKRFNV